MSNITDESVLSFVEGFQFVNAGVVYAIKFSNAFRQLVNFAHNACWSKSDAGISCFRRLDFTY